jgi:predicted O-linked N-acetylglucosamine transferase (SPINDLY family)
VLGEVNVSYFYLPYQGMNERETQARLARVFLKAAPELAFVAPRLMQAAAPGRRLKVGVASNFLGRRHSVGIAYNGLIRALAARHDLEMHLVCFSDDDATATRAAFGRHTPVVALPKHDLAQSRERLAALELDVLLYADIGMDPFTYYLAFGRYAPLQGVLGGHPLTTGIPTLDVYVSSRLQETAQAQEHYTERLVPLEGFAMGMERPAPPPPRSRQQLGLPASGNLYVCPLRIHRLHPEFDAALAGILDADEDAEIVLFEDVFQEVWDRQVRSRLMRSLGRRVERITFLSWQSPENFLAILAGCQVALDSFHFGAGTTAPLAFAVGCPMVTLPSQFQRGRSTLAYYLAMQIDDCVATDPQDYVRIAVRIARDPQYRQSLGARLRERSAVLFDTAASAAELGDTLHRLYRERVACSPT